MLYYSLLATYLLLYAFLSWRNFNFALAFLFFCLPTYLIRFNLGPLPTTLLEIMIGIITIVWLIKYRKTIISNFKFQISKYKNFFIAISLFLLAATISVFISINFRSALGEWKAFYVEPIILFIIIITTIRQDNKTINRIIYALVLSALITSILAIYQHFTGWLVPDAFWANQNTYRVTAWYGFPSAVGLFLAPLIPLAIYLIKPAFLNLKNKNWWLKIENYKYFIDSLLIIPCGILAIIFAKSTGALIGLAAGLIFFLFFYNKKTRIVACLISLVGLVSIVILPQSNPIKQELFFQNRSGQLRVNMWAETTEFLKAHPIAGAGLASYSKLIYPYRIDKWIEVFHHPHNIFLTMWVNLGLLGLFAFVWIIVTIFKISFATKTYNLQLTTYNLSVITSMVIILVMGLVDSPYIKNDLAILFWLLPALLITSRHCEERGTSDPSSPLGTGSAI